MSEKKDKRKTLNKVCQDLIINKKEKEKSEIHIKNEMITNKILQNLDLTTYDYIFLDRQINNTKVQDFSSFIELLNDIKKRYKPESINSGIQLINEEGKFSFNKYNITKLISFNDKKMKNMEISINNRYVRILDIKNKYARFYLSKSIYKGKHCFEIEIMGMNNICFEFGLLNINHIEEFKKEFCKSRNNNELSNNNNLNLVHNYESFKLENPIFIKKENDFVHHYIKYGDILGLCFDLTQKLLYLYLNGEIINTYILNIETGPNISFVPFISLNKFSEIIFNQENLKYEDNYKKLEFIPFDNKDKNNYEKSQLKYVTNEFINILIDNGNSIITNKNMSYSDINQIYHIIFDFLGNISFQHSYIIQNCFIKIFESKKDINNNDDLELYYLCIRYILNSVKEQKSLLSNILFNLIESIHIYLIRGNSSFKKLFNLLIYLFSKKDIQNILSKFRSSTIKRIFSQIFINFYLYEELFHKINLDLIIKTRASLINININNKDKIFKDLSTNYYSFNKYLISTLNEYDEQNINEIFSKFVEVLLKNGIKKEEDDNNSNDFLIKHLNDFLKEEKEKIIKLPYSMNPKFIEIFKAYFIPAMILFNNAYNNNKTNDKNLISYSVKKYLIDIESEKLGGTIKNITEQIINDIPNFEDIKNMKINNYNNIFLLQFFDFFLGKDSRTLWDELTNIVSKSDIYNANAFINSREKDSYEKVHNKYIRFIEYKFIFPYFNEIYIFINFIKNITNFFLDELYPKKLIYFFPEKIIIKFGSIITLLKNILSGLNDNKKEKEDIMDSFLKSNEIDNNVYNNVYIDKLNKIKNNLEISCKGCLKQVITLLIKIISDKNVKKISFKCDILSILQSIIAQEEFFTDEEIINIFDFMKEIHNNPEYKRIINKFMQVFENKIITTNAQRQNVFTKFADRIYNICKKKENNKLLQTILVLLYSNVNESLSKLEEIFAEYKYNPRSNARINVNIANNNNDNNNNDNNDDGNNDNNEEDIEMNNDGFNGRFMGIGFVVNELVQQIRGGRLNRQRNPNIIFRIIPNPIRNYQQLNDREKLEILHDNIKKASIEFIKLINFYKLSHDIKELYNFDCIENKCLDNLLGSLYNVVFSPNNSSKINDNDVINSYKKLQEKILKFLNTIFKNISTINDDKILNEIAKRRNIYHLKEISECFDKLCEQKKPENNINSIKTINLFNDSKLYNKFIEYLEKLVPEKETTKLINTGETPGNSALKSEEKNLCPICADSVIDTHIIPCEHSICRNCLFQCLSGNKACPFCRVQIQGIKEDKNYKI